MRGLPVLTAQCVLRDDDVSWYVSRVSTSIRVPTSVSQVLVKLPLNIHRHIKYTPMRTSDAAEILRHRIFGRTMTPEDIAEMDEIRREMEAEDIPDEERDDIIREIEAEEAEPMDPEMLELFDEAMSKDD